MLSNNKFRILLLPFSWIYGIIVSVRNLLFDTEIIKSISFETPVISVGNITVGGTGKTPHIEYLIRLFSPEYKVAVLSRGYKRKTKGFFLAKHDSTVNEIGDESLQLKKKFPDIIVAVDEKRKRGIEILESDSSNKPDVILLDDAYQHRYVKPAISVLLTDKNKMFTDDRLLPAGNLREYSSGSKRANIIVITKCPDNLMPIEFRMLKNKIDLYPQQSIFISSIKYGELTNILDRTEVLRFNDIKNQKRPVLLITGIANPEPLYSYISEYSNDIKTMVFSDHHWFSKKDYSKIKSEFDKIESNGGIIITTEKDSMRFYDNPLFDDLKKDIFYTEIEISFPENQESEFKSKIIDYVRINRRNR